MVTTVRSDKLRGKRAEKGLSAMDMGGFLGITGNAYLYKEKGERLFNLGEACAVANVLDLSLDEFNLIFFDEMLPYGSTSEPKR